MVSGYSLLFPQYTINVHVKAEMALNPNPWPPRTRRISLGDVNIVIPTLNEEKAIGLVLEELFSIGVKPEQVIVVDGHSTDRTREIASSKGVRVILQEGKGKADAIKTVLRYIDKPYTLVMDGDYTYPAYEIPKLVEKASRGFDEVIGARVNGRENIPLLNRLGNWIITKVFNILFGTNLRDVCSGMYLVNTRILREAPIESRGFSVEVDIAAKVASLTGRITEVPISYRKRIGEKKLRIIHGLYIVKDLVRLAWRYNPASLIFILGAVLTIPGIVIDSWVLLELLLYGIKRHVWATLGTLLTLTGLLSLALSIIAVYLKRFEYRLNQKLAIIHDMLEELESRLRSKS